DGGGWDGWGRAASSSSLVSVIPPACALRYNTGAAQSSMYRSMALRLDRASAKAPSMGVARRRASDHRSMNRMALVSRLVDCIAITAGTPAVLSAAAMLANA